MDKDKGAKLQEMIALLGVDITGIVSLNDADSRLRETAQRLLPEARSVVVMGMEIYREILEHAVPAKQTESLRMREMLDSHHDFLNDRLNDASYEIVRASHRLGLKAFPLPSRGLPFNSRMLTAPFPYKHAAQAAGLGGIGRHSMVVSPQFGPRLRLACCLTEAELQPNQPGSPHQCGSCRICIDSCPVKALTMPGGPELYSIDRFACGTFRTGNFCSECMRLCPAGRK